MMIRTHDIGRFTTLGLVAFFALASLVSLLWSGWMIIPLAIFSSLTALGVRDLTQRSHSILRNYPVLGHMGFVAQMGWWDSLYESNVIAEVDEQLVPYEVQDHELVVLQ